jgi:Holliday junction resolvase-like predicted endonuclease
VGEKLKELGFEIIKANWRTPYGEVDLVAAHEKTLLILEIKTLSSRFLKSRNPLGFAQRQRLSRAAKFIWQQKRNDYIEFNCQLVIVTECGMKWITLPLLYDQA